MEPKTDIVTPAGTTTTQPAQKMAASEVPVDDAQAIRALYTELALKPDQNFGWGTGPANAANMGYKEYMAKLPNEVFASNAAGGCPFALQDKVDAWIKPGMTVVDFGSGAGGDVCVAGSLVGPEGKVYGIDATPAMIELAMKNIERCGFTDHCTIIEGTPEWPQVSGGTRKGKLWESKIARKIADFVISNNVINLLNYE